MKPRSILAVALALGAMLTGCAVDPATNVRFTRTAPDGSTIEARVDRAWQGGPVTVRGEFDPVTGRWVVVWRSDVELEPAVEASRVQAAAQSAAFQAGLEAGIRAARAAVLGTQGTSTIGEVTR